MLGDHNVVSFCWWEIPKKILQICWQRFSYLFEPPWIAKNIKYLNSTVSLWVASNLAHLAKNFFALKKLLWGLNFFIFFLVKLHNTNHWLYIILCCGISLDHIPTVINISKLFHENEAKYLIPLEIMLPHCTHPMMDWMSACLKLQPSFWHWSCIKNGCYFSFLFQECLP